ncbi:hypothetical protein BC937DRAFT_90510 [Endogone sp. FLAS-F59071]|nr:hypothetical protein BC937DRAFT_90510 [Endogone sp. FLAS-F59071]|eukprot:RUS22073.1 hypothetical protein BC937DRAFT_90510 [Endogone sp. FLAS-F59071]
MVAASVVIIFFLLMRWYDKKLVDRVSLRLNLAISITDLFSHISIVLFNFLAYKYHISCNPVVAGCVGLSNQYVFFSAAIAFNLQYLFLHKKPFNPNIEKWYYILSIGLSVLSVGIPVAAGRYGFDEAQHSCWYTPSGSTVSLIWEFSTLEIPTIICIVYCLLIVVLVGLKLWRESAEMDAQTPSQNVADRRRSRSSDAEFLRQQKTRRTINRVVRRVLLYPLVPFITQTGFIVAQIDMYVTSSSSFPLNVWGVIGKASPGLWNCIAFMLDPAVATALSHLRRDLIAKYGEPNLKPTDSFFAAKPDPSAYPPRAGFMPWFVRKFLMASKKTSDDDRMFLEMNYDPDADDEIGMASLGNRLVHKHASSDDITADNTIVAILPRPIGSPGSSETSPESSLGSTLDGGNQWIRAQSIGLAVIHLEANWKVRIFSITIAHPGHAQLTLIVRFTVALFASRVDPQKEIWPLNV